MTLNKEWMSYSRHDRINPTYCDGVESFLKFASAREGDSVNVRCPCVKCKNRKNFSLDEIKIHLLAYGIMMDYTVWFHHGETFVEEEDANEVTSDSDVDANEDQNEYEDDVEDDIEDEDDTNITLPELDANKEMHDFLGDIFYKFPCPTTSYPKDDLNEHENSDDPLDYNELDDVSNDDAKKFYSSMKDLKQALYPGSRISTISTMVKLLHIKNIGHWSNASFTSLFKFLKEDVLPIGSNLPDSYHEARKIISNLGLNYHKIDACPNDCMLYWKEDEKANFCKVCGISRWKNYMQDEKRKNKLSKKKLAIKTLRYFPLTPRLQRRYMSKKTAPDMRWHYDRMVQNNKMSHPADSEAWKWVDDKFKDFAAESRNIRLGLATDGFQPFENAKKPHSIWPVFLIPYNLPPWLCMKQSNFILSLIIPGPEGPGDAIDIYLQPLIYELKQLWEVGVNTYDASTGQNFNLRAILLWTLNDFPAYSMLSGWSTKGKLACPVCNKGTHSIRLKNGCKQCYMGHRRFLPMSHKWRNDSISFDGFKDLRFPPINLTGDSILTQVADLKGRQFSKAPNKKFKVSHELRGDNWNKKSIFFDLPYWKTLLLRHNLDVMHIIKNIGESCLGTFLDLPGKSKDNLKSRLDLKLMGIRPNLHPIVIGEKVELPHAPYMLTAEGKQIFCEFLKGLKVPDGFSSNISYSVNIKERIIFGLKSHDYYVIVKYLLPLAVRGLLDTSIVEVIAELASFFTELCGKVLDLDILDEIDEQIPLILCKLEKIFPPSFFDIMMHLPIHLATEARVAGPVQFRWMFPIEQSQGMLKKLIRNRSHPEGSIAEGYIAYECIDLCSRYLTNIETKFNLLSRNFGAVSKNNFLTLSLFEKSGRPLGAAHTRSLNLVEWEQAHNYIIRNCDELQKYISSYNILDKPNTSLHEWIRIQVEEQYKGQNKLDDILSLVIGPSKYVKCYKGLIINGHRFHIKEHEDSLKTQNSGVVVTGDFGDESEKINFYGILMEILEVQYMGLQTVFLFRCKWFDIHDSKNGIKVDKNGVVSINAQKLLKTNEPFVLATQVAKVFYVNDISSKGWKVVIKINSRDLMEMPNFAYE